MAVSKYDISGNGRFFTAAETILYASDSTPFEQPQTGSLLRSMIVQPDGKIVLAGKSYAGVTLIRLNSSGERDTSFNGDGRATALIGPASNQFQDYCGADLLHQPEGRLIVVGLLYTFGLSRPINMDFALARFLNPIQTATSTTVSLSAAGNMGIKDLWGRDGQLELRVLGGELWVTDMTLDSRAVFTVTGLPAITGNETKQIRIPVSLISAIGKPLIFNTMAGDDSLVQFGFESAFDSTGLRFLGGLGRDRLSFENYITPTIWNISAVGNGQVTPTGRGTRFFSSVESIRVGAGADEFRLTAGTVATLVGVDGGEDLLIGAHSAHFDRYAGPADRLALFAAWIAPESCADRVNRLLNTGVTGASGLVKLTPANTVFEDGIVDTLFGDDGFDWFFAATSGNNSEVGLASGGLRDLGLDEVLTPLI